MKLSYCPQCGLSVAEFNKTGRLGCSECYVAFAGELPVLLLRIHGREHHIGKVPAMNPIQLEARKELLTLRRQLKRAIEREEFESAAELRDRINEIERITEPQKLAQR